MYACRRARWLVVVTFVVLVAVSCVLDANAQLSIFWRTSVVSWDSSTTQFQDELAVQGIAYVDAARQLREHAGAAVVPAGRLAAPSDHGPGSTVVITSRLTRSPPAA